MASPASKKPRLVFRLSFVGWYCLLGSSLETVLRARTSLFRSLTWVAYNLQRFMSKVDFLIVCIISSLAQTSGYD
jgi:hypothetical protein